MAQPQTLRSLYMQSDLVVVAHLADSVQAQESSGPSTLLKTKLLVSETWKGEADPKGVALFHWVWKMGGQIDRAPGAGEHLLLFLTRRETNDGYDITRDSYGVRIISSAELKVYRRRVEELGVIMRQNPPDKGDLVEWVVRCAEDPATRWDGAYELLSNQYAEKSFAANANAATANVEAPAEAAGDASRTPETSAAAVAAESEPVVAGEAALVKSDDAFPSDAEIIELPIYTSDSAINFLARLTVEQKQRLLESLYNTQSVTYSEVTLLEVVKDWSDERLVPFLLSHLQRIKDNPDYYAEQIISLVAQKLNDKELVQLADRYSSLARYVDEIEGEASADEEETVETSGDEEETNTDAANESETASATNQQAATPEPEPAVPEAKDGRTAQQQRSARLQEFVALVELKMMQQLARKY
jgi:hypothetical protein